MHNLNETLEAAQHSLREVVRKLRDPGVMTLAGLAEAARAVEDFHVKYDLSRKTRLERSTDTKSKELFEHIAATLSTLAESLLPASKTDVRALRAHLIVEEVGELVMAFAEGDEIKTLDAAADLLYVLLGTTVTFGLPLGEAFIEVHRSNMTKKKSAKDPHSQRLRDKGDEYVAPNLLQVLREYHTRLVKPHVWNPESDECSNCGMSMAQMIKQRNKYGKANCKGHHV